MDFFSQFENLIPIVVIVIYCLVEILKRFWLKTDSQRALIPVGCAIFGAIAGGVLFCFFPESFEEDSNIISAITSGGFSGLAATGTNQLYKKIKSFLTLKDTIE